MKETKAKEINGQVTFPREVEIMQRLSHPHIVEFVDAFIWNKRAHVVMERLAMHLDQYRELQPRRQLSIAAIQSVARHSLGGLDYLHGNGITHRDLKPENILVAGDDLITKLPIIKLADFGLSNAQVALLEICTAILPQSIYGPWGWYSTSFWEVNFNNRWMAAGTLRRDFNGAKRPAARLVAKMLTIDPEQRPTAATCLQDPWLATGNHILAQLQEKRFRSFSHSTRDEAQPRKKAQSSIPDTQVGYSGAETSSVPQTSLNSADDVTPLGTVRQVEGLILAY
ncbi:hypothetical protein VE02_04106 [Pseudogymnoascus sp. 03VT05]|nr:hypothetical protein VE02_04106 [Pseudogymnoascus sp. 03VT05]